MENCFDEKQFEYLLNEKSIFCTGCHMIRVSALKEVNPKFEIYPARRGQNWQLLLPIYYKYKRFFLDEPLYGYVIYAQSMSQGDVTKVCATLKSPKTGIVLDVYTNEPGIQVYCGNFLDGTLTGKKGIVYNFRAAVCLETDKYPDTPNKPEWPSAVLRPGEKYQSQCIYKFSVHK